MDGLQSADFHAFHAGAPGPVGVASASDGAAFAHALAHAPLPRQTLHTIEARTPGDRLALDRLAGHLETIERTRIEARRLPERIVQAHANGAGTADIALAMHRQARLMAAYQLDVLWTAKIVGAATASVKQLISAS